MADIEEDNIADNDRKGELVKIERLGDGRERVYTKYQRTLPSGNIGFYTVKSIRNTCGDDLLNVGRPKIKDDMLKMRSRVRRSINRMTESQIKVICALLDGYEL